MATIRVQGKRLAVSGSVGYQGAARFAEACGKFLAGAGKSGGTLDLSAVEDLVSRCLAAVYDAARVHQPADLSIVVPERLALLFAPGEIEGLFTVKTREAAPGAKD